METLRNKLEEANGDISALRKQLQKNRVLENVTDGKSASPVESICSVLEYEQIVQELEKVQNKVKHVNVSCLLPIQKYLSQLNSLTSVTYTILHTIKN